MNSSISQIVCVLGLLGSISGVSFAGEYHIKITKQRGNMGGRGVTTWDNENSIRIILDETFEFDYRDGDVTKGIKSFKVPFDALYTMTVRHWGLRGDNHIFIYVEDTGNISEFSNNGKDKVCSCGPSKQEGTTFTFNDFQIDRGQGGGLYRYFVSISKNE